MFKVILLTIVLAGCSTLESRVDDYCSGYSDSVVRALLREGIEIYSKQEIFDVCKEEALEGNYPYDYQYYNTELPY